MRDQKNPDWILSQNLRYGVDGAPMSDLEVGDLENIRLDILENSNDNNAQNVEDDNQSSAYFKSSSGDVRMRYKDKISIIQKIDPYTPGVDSPYLYKNGLPEVTHLDIVAYFLSTHSFFTGEKLKSYKSLESYKFCEVGYVRDVCIYKIGEYFVVQAKVGSLDFLSSKFCIS